ncbi:cytochrome P450 family protein [Streptomyces sp. NPDC003006]
MNTTTHGEVWAVLAHEEAGEALADPCLRTSPIGIGEPESDRGVLNRTMLESHPPEHTRLRRLVAKDFTNHRVRILRPHIQQVADELLDAMAPLGRTDLIESFALPLPAAIICELLGVPVTDRTDFHQWSSDIVTATSVEAGAAAAQAMAQYLATLVDAKHSGQEGEDLLSALARAADDDGDRLSREELLAMAFLLLFAGHETTVNLIANGCYALLRHPDQLAELRADWTLLDGAIEEMLRYESPVKDCALRFAAEPVNIAGTAIPAGERVLIVLAAACRDPRRFTEPDRFDIRRDTHGHLALGHGIHHCLGAALARQEAAVALRTLLERCPDIALDADPADLVWRPSIWLRGLARLPVRYSQVAPAQTN